jgi:hypothetical protein
MLISRQNSSLLTAIDRWENEGGATELPEAHLLDSAMSGLALSRKLVMSQHRPCAKPIRPRPIPTARSGTHDR